MLPFGLVSFGLPGTDSGHGKGAVLPMFLYRYELGLPVPRTMERAGDVAGRTRDGKAAVPFLVSQVKAVSFG